MLFKNYEYFMAIVETKSISKAAEHLYISQPSLSKYLKRLEEKIGEPLFNRSSYPLKLTRAGEIYLTYLTDILRKEKLMAQELSTLQNEENGMVTIGITPWRSSVLLPRVFPEFKIRYPGISVTIKEGTHQEMASMIERKMVDFCIFHLPNVYNNFTFEHLYYEKILFCINKKNPFLDNYHYTTGRINRMSSKDFERFAESPFILLRKGQNIRHISDNYLNKCNIRPNILLETSNIVTAINIVRNGMGVTFIPEGAVLDAAQSKDLEFFSLDTPPLQWEVGIAYKTGNILNQCDRLFIDFIRNSNTNFF